MTDRVEPARWRMARPAAWAVWAGTASLTVAWIPLVRLARTQEGRLPGSILIPLFVLGFATVGALITSRQPTNRIGLAYAVVAFAGAIALVSGAYAQLPFSAGIHVPQFRYAAWLGRVGFEAMTLPLAFVFLLFPDGRVPTPRWRPVLWTMLAAAATNLIGWVVTPGPLAGGFTYTPQSVANPFGAPRQWKGTIDGVTGAAGLVLFAGALLGVVALVLRYRRSGGEERQQIRWLAYVGSAGVGIVLLAILAMATSPVTGIAVESDTFWTFLWIPFLLVLFVGTPTASLVAAFKYRLWELDVVVKKTLIAGVVVVLLGGIAATLLATVGQVALWKGTPRGVSVVVGLVIGLLFVPVLRTSRRIADRIVYGGRATPYEVLSGISHRMADTYATEEVLPRLASILAAGIGAERATIWLATGGELRPEAEWPETPEPGAPLPMEELASRGAFEVRHVGELLGAITVAMPANDPMNPGRERLVTDLAAQMGPMLRNVKLVEDLRESRRRIVSAQDERARKLERDLHDGAQQQLVALAVKLRLAGRLVDQDAERARASLDELAAEVTDALECLRDLAHGIYPPLLADEGLVEAIGAQARKAPLPVEVAAEGIARYPEEVESAVYFCVLEALNNVAKYAAATSASIRLEAQDDVLSFTIDDDGVGFDTGAVRGTGLQGMIDRIDAVGGTVEISSAPGRGSSIRGRLPIPPGDWTRG